jgi:quinol-cytochrome oxidoreductase complex cytochrome b subunit
MRIIKSNILLNTIYNSLIIYPAPATITYLWNFGVLAGICLIIQILSGIFLAMHYIPHIDFAFISIEHIMRDVNNGWLLRYVHANGASMFFLVVYIHLFRGLYYGSYLKPKTFVWILGVLILFLMIATAFMGYVLPWGQMSFWAATVITNFASAIPIIGNDIVYWLWGGFSVDNPTLNRFFSFHYLLPFILLGLVFLHIIFLHETGSSSPLGINKNHDLIPFHPYFTIKDIFGLIIFLLFFSYFIFFQPNLLGHPDNYIEANPLVTPTHIVPEWYFLPFYAILRAVPNKLGGVILLLMAIFILILLPFFLKRSIKSSIFSPLNKFFFWFFVGNSIILGWLGGQPAEEPFIMIAQFSTFFYFFYFLAILPLIEIIESKLVLYTKK